MLPNRWIQNSQRNIDWRGGNMIFRSVGAQQQIPRITPRIYWSKISYRSLHTIINERYVNHYSRINSWRDVSIFVKRNQNEENAPLQSEGKLTAFKAVLACLLQSVCSETSFDLRSAGYEVWQVLFSKQMAVAFTDCRLCLSNLNL